MTRPSTAFHNCGGIRPAVHRRPRCVTVIVKRSTKQVRRVVTGTGKGVRVEVVLVCPVEAQAITVLTLVALAVLPPIDSSIERRAARGDQKRG